MVNKFQKLFSFILIVFVFLFTFSLNQIQAQTSSVPTLTTPTISDLTTTSATLGATVTSLGLPASISERGTCFGTTANPTTNCVATSGTTTGTFSQARTGLSPGVTYYFRGYAINTTGTGYSPDGTFSTAVVAPTVTTPIVSNINTTNAVLGATVTSLGLPPSISERGICLGTTANPTTNCVAASGTTTGAYSQTRTLLTPGTTYYFRGYAINIIGTGYSPDGTFTTTAFPVLTTPTVSAVTTTSATLGATVTSLGLPASISERGTCFGTTANPTTNCVATSGTTTGTFSQARTGLSPGVTYYFRGYARNSTGTGYSPDGTFTTVSSLPIITSPTASAITTTSATLGADITSLGVIEGILVTISERGICLGTSPSPITNCIAVSGTTIGAYSQTRTELTPGTKYYFRGYAKNISGTGYSLDGTFITNSIPTLTNPTVSAINTTGATLGATVESLGIPLIISERGTCFGITPNPTTNCVSASGKTTGAYSHIRTGLKPGVSYFFRGYATNSTGTGYSPDGTFTTSANTPSVTSPTVSAVNTTSAKLGATITSLGLPASVSERGICIGITASPSITCVSIPVVRGATTGAYSRTITGLTSGTKYFFRGYAKNTIGTGYSPDGTFTTENGIVVTASVISSSGLIEVVILNDNPDKLKIKAEYGEGNFGLKSNFFSFNKKGYGTATLTALRQGKTYKYRLLDDTGVLKPSDTYVFTTAPGVFSYIPLLWVITSGAPTDQFVGPSFSVSNITSDSVTLNAKDLKPGETYTFKIVSVDGIPDVQITASGEGTASGSFSLLNSNQNFIVALAKRDPTSGILVSAEAPLVHFTTLKSNLPVGDYNPIGTPAPTPFTPSTSSTPLGPTSTGGLVKCGRTVDANGNVVQCTFKDLLILFNNVVKFILFDMVVPITAIMFFYAGFLMITGGGESASSRTKAKKIFTNAVIGLVVAVGAWVIVHTLLSILGYDASWIGL